MRIQEKPKKTAKGAFFDYPRRHRISSDVCATPRRSQGLDLQVGHSWTGNIQVIFLP